MLSNFQVNEMAAVQFCLLGQPQFRDILASDDLAQLRQRVVATYHLGPLSPDETRAYVEHRLQLVNWQQDPDLTDAAYAHIHADTAGVPRQINVLCDRLFLYGMIEELHHLEAKDVDAVAAEMAGEGMRAEPDARATAAAPLSTSAQAAIALCQDRIDALEKTVKIHDKTIKRGIELAASYLNQEIQQPKQPNNDDPAKPHAMSR